MVSFLVIGEHVSFWRSRSISLFSDENCFLFLGRHLLPPSGGFPGHRCEYVSFLRSRSISRSSDENCFLFLGRQQLTSSDIFPRHRRTCLVLSF